MPGKIARLSLAPVLGIGVLVLMMLTLPAAAGPGAAAAMLQAPAAGAPILGMQFFDSGQAAGSGETMRPEWAAARPAAPASAPGLTVNYAHDWVCVRVGPSAAFQVTVSRGGAALAALSAIADINGDYCSGEHNDWGPGRPDIQVGDAVTLASPGVTAAVDPVGEIAGALDVGSSTVSGALHVPAFGQTPLSVRCEVWVEGAQISPIVLPNVPATGGAYTCDFGAQGFHMAPGDSIAVIYFEPDLDQVINVFRAPAPDISINVWPEGMAVARAGGPAVFHIGYQNNGSAPAEDVVITDTLPADVAFVPGPAPVVPEVTAGQVVWRLGSLAPGEAGHFFVVLTNNLPGGTTLEHVAAIGTSSRGDNPNDNQRSASVPVTAGTPDANVGVWAQPRDARSGDSYLLRVNYGNNAPVPAGPVTLHVQLPADTTLQSWSSQNYYDPLWALTSSVDGHLIFEAPALPANFGDQLLVQVNIAGTVGANVQLVTTAWIEPPDDADPSNNGPFNCEVWTTGETRPDLSVDKQWSDGMLVQGGRAQYNLNYSNDGNQTQAGVRLTDTLPAGTTFVTATVDANWGISTPLAPDYQEGGKVAWDLDTLPPGRWGHLRVQLALDGVQPMTTLTNTADIQGLDHDRSWWNNHAMAVEQVNPSGTNLRIRQDSSWEWPGQIRYSLHFENLGTTRVMNVRITDTLPLDLGFNNGWWGNAPGDLKLVDYNATTREIVWAINMLEPGWAGNINFRADVPPADIGHQGMVHHNQAEITLPDDDVSPSDNSTTEAAWTGPDLYVKKSLNGGKLAAGGVVTFTVEFGNRSNGPWNTGNPPQGSPAIYITNTLPAGLTFLSATDPFAPYRTWPPSHVEGNQVTWNLDGACASCRFAFQVTARIENAASGKELVNTVQIADVVPGDVDPFPANNTSSWSGRVRADVYLPLLGK